jgi:Putative zinc-finger
MTCELVQLEISARMDGEHLAPERAADVDAHVATCERCRAFADRSARVRAATRIRAAEPVPDLVAGIMSRLEVEASPDVTRGTPPGAVPATPPGATPATPAAAARWRRALPAVAALVAGAVVGSVLVGGPFRGGDRDAVSAEAVVRAVRVASPALRSFQGTYEVVERGLSEKVPERRFDMRIAFLAPQRFRLDVVDRTAYPTAGWIPNDIAYVEDAPRASLTAPTSCPPGIPGGGCPTTRTTVTVGSRLSLADLIVPMATFGSSAGVHVLDPGASIDGRDVVPIELTFARAAPMFPFLEAGGVWRPFFRGDRVEMELDAESWLPRRITVYPADSDARRAWELRFGLQVEGPATPILDVRSVTAGDETPDPALFAVPGAPAELSLDELAERVGYRPATPEETGDLELTAAAAPDDPDGPRSLLVYADGLDVLRIAERPNREPARFGAVGASAERIDLGPRGIAYYAPADALHGRRLTLVGDRTTVVLETNLPRDELLAIAASLPMRGRAHP